MCWSEGPGGPGCRPDGLCWDSGRDCGSDGVSEGLRSVPSEGLGCCPGALWKLRSVTKPAGRAPAASPGRCTPGLAWAQAPPAWAGLGLYCEGGVAWGQLASSDLRCGLSVELGSRGLRGGHLGLLCWAPWCSGAWPLAAVEAASCPCPGCALPAPTLPRPPWCSSLPPALVTMWVQHGSVDAGQRPLLGLPARPLPLAWWGEAHVPAHGLSTSSLLSHSPRWVPSCPLYSKCGSCDLPVLICYAAHFLVDSTRPGAHQGP